jgi:hypothetical protein
MFDHTRHVERGRILGDLCNQKKKKKGEENPEGKALTRKDKGWRKSRNVRVRARNAAAFPLAQRRLNRAWSGSWTWERIENTEEDEGILRE